MNFSPSLPDSGFPDTRLDILQTLAPVTRAIGLTHVIRGVLFGFALGALVGVVLLFGAHLHPFALAVPLALGVVAAGLLVGAGYGVSRWPQPAEAARRADLHFSLDDRLTTALELTAVDTPVAVLQSQDLARRIADVPLSACRGRRLLWREAVIVMLAAVAFAGALVFRPPVAVHPAAAERASHAVQVRRAAARRVRNLATQLHAGLTPAQQGSPALRKLDAALTQLRHRLLKATSPRSTLRAISLTQQQLRHLSQGLHPLNAKAVAQLNGSLSHYLQHNQSGGKRSGAGLHSSAGMARALSALARSLAHMSPAQRAALARTLAQTANATPNNAMRQALRQAASALANGEPRAAQAALQQAARMLARNAAAQAALSRSAAAQAQLNALESQVAQQLAASSQGQRSGQSSAAQAKGSAGAQQTGAASSGAPGFGSKTGRNRGAGQGKGQNGVGSRQGQGAGQAAGPGRGTGRGTGAGQGKGTGTGRARGQGRGSGQGRGLVAGRNAVNGRGTGARTGTAGAHGSGGRGSASSTRKGKTVTVFVPGKQGTGPSITRNGPNGDAAPGAVVPYQQVVGKYSATARQALDREALPPSLQSYVRSYFTTLSR